MAENSPPNPKTENDEEKPQGYITKEDEEEPLTSKELKGWYTYNFAVGVF